MRNQSPRTYALPRGILPEQTERTIDRAVFKVAYAFIPNRVMTDIVSGGMPHWDKSFFWVLARPLSGFAETFSQYIVKVEPGGGSEWPEPEDDAEAVLFVMSGSMRIAIDGAEHQLTPGSYVFIGPKSRWSLRNDFNAPCFFQWIRKKYRYVNGLEPPNSFVSHDDDVEPVSMENAGGAWATSRFVDPDDMAHDMHVNIVTFRPGGVIPFSETHVMEHGLYVLEGKAIYQLNEDWIEVEAGDFMWLRAFCPQACYASGPGLFRYILYKDMNRHPNLTLG